MQGIVSVVLVTRVPFLDTIIMTQSLDNSIDSIDTILTLKLDSELLSEIDGLNSNNK